MSGAELSGGQWLMADTIAVLDGGALGEIGSHRELIANNGLYAELFRLQARAYG